MKQAELNKLLGAARKQSAKAHGWKCSRGFIFKATDLLFFSIIVLGRANLRHLSYTLSYKLLAFDDLFWKIVKTEENAKQPLSFRASGAWTAPTMTISEGESPITDWNTQNIDAGVNEIISRCELDIEKTCGSVHGLDDNLRLVEALYLSHQKAYPKTALNIWVERLLTAVLKHQYSEAKKIVQDRINSRDTGGFQVGSKWFYSLANEYLHSLS
jgi:hypothetical protein